jgi:hypothetical protein
MTNNRHNEKSDLPSRKTRTNAVKETTATNENKITISFWQLLSSTLAAFIGVQSNANRERDFKHGKISHFIAIGILFGITFVLTIITVVKIVMASVGA